jgi:hypothetical protein
MKTSSTFKLSKSSKRVLATITNSQERGDLKRMMIEAEVSFARAKLAKISKGRSEEKVS